MLGSLRVLSHSIGEPQVAGQDSLKTCPALQYVYARLG